MASSATSSSSSATLEWFGATTFRLKTRGLTIFLDTWIERPSTIAQYLTVDDVTECDYIFISHAHFDHLPGANKIALKTGAVIIGNGEAISVMRAAGVPEAQLMAVSGGERIPLFTAASRQKAAAQPPPPPGLPPPGKLPGPPTPPVSEAVLSVHVWPALHCLMVPGAHPEYIDTATSYTGDGADDPQSYACTLDITRALTYGLGGLAKMDPLPASLPPDFRVFIDYLKDGDSNRYSTFDGGQLMYNFVGDKTLLWNGHLGGYTGILQGLRPQPDVAVLGIAGRANVDGRPWQGSAAEFAVQQLQWLGEPARVLWCLHDRGPLPPYYIDTKAATAAVHKETKSKVVDLEPVAVYHLCYLQPASLHPCLLLPRSQLVLRVGHVHKLPAFPKARVLRRLVIHVTSRAGCKTRRDKVLVRRRRHRQVVAPQHHLHPVVAVQVVHRAAGGDHKYVTVSQRTYHAMQRQHELQCIFKALKAAVPMLVESSDREETSVLIDSSAALRFVREVHDSLSLEKALEQAHRPERGVDNLARVVPLAIVVILAGPTISQAIIPLTAAIAAGNAPILVLDPVSSQTGKLLYETLCGSGIDRSIEMLSAFCCPALSMSGGQS